MKTILHTFRFNLEKPEEAEAWKALKVQLANHPHPMESWGADRSTAEGEHYHKAAQALDGKSVTLELEHLFNNQWNTTPIDGITENGLRVFDWKIDLWPNRKIKSGHYLEQTDEMREIRRNTATCGYCGKQEPAAKGYVFCPHCLDNQYLKEDNLHLTRMVPVDVDDRRAELTEAERAHLLPLYKAAQLHGTTERGKARIAKAKTDIETEYTKAIENATEKRDAARWIMAHIPGMLDNWLFYTHSGKHSFGWRTALDQTQVSALLEVISEFPFVYEIKCADGRTLENYAE